MRRLIGLVSLFAALPGIGSAHSISVAFHDSADPTKSISCAVSLHAGRMTVAEVIGTGLPPPQGLRWVTTAEETAAMTDALQALLRVAPTTETILSSRAPLPPYVQVIWLTDLDGQIVSGLTFGNAEELAPELHRLIRSVLSGSRCDHRLQRP
jgi:hypothetical protein